MHMEDLGIRRAVGLGHFSRCSSPRRQGDIAIVEGGLGKGSLGEHFGKSKLAIIERDCCFLSPRVAELFDLG